MALTAKRVVEIDFIAQDKGVGDVVNGVKSNLAAVVAIAGAAAAAIKFVGDETERLDGIAKDFAKSGLSNVEVYQELDQVAKLGGSSVGKLSKATVRLDRNLFAISQKSGKAANDALKALNLTGEQLADASDTERLGILADALFDVEDRTRRAALAEELLGKSGRDILPVLAAGSAGLEEMAASVGKTFTGEELARAEAYQDALVKLEKTGADVRGELAIGIAPVFTEFADSLSESGQTADAVMPLIIGYVKEVGGNLAVVFKWVGLVAEGLGAVGRVGDLIGGRLSSASDSVGEFISESRIGEWAASASESMGDLTGDADSLTARIAAQIPISDDLAMSWDEVTRAITGADVAAKGTIFDGAKKALGGILNIGKDIKRQREEAAALEAERVDVLLAEAATAEFISDRTAAEGGEQEHVNQLMLEGLRLRAQAADLQADITLEAKDQVKALEAQRKLEVAEAKVAAASSKGRGGRGPTQAARLLAAGEQRVSQMEHMARLAGIIATNADETADAAEFTRAAALERLALEREALEVTKARGEFAKQELANKLEANAQAASELEAAGDAEARAREKDDLAEIISIETARSANEAEAAAARLNMLGMEFEAREVLRQQRELELVNNPAEGELAQIEQKGALQQLEFDRQMDRNDQEAAAAEARSDLAEALHEAELKRIAELEKRRKATIDATGRVLSSGQRLASAVISASIKDEDKRAKAEMKARGIMALATGALEVVRGVAAAASLNPVQAALHAAAAVVAFATGASLIAGNPQGASTGGGGGAAAAASAPARDTSSAATTVESLPAADREPGQQPTQDMGGGGGVTNIENINVTGAIDDDTAEKIRLALDNVNNGLAEAG